MKLALILVLSLSSAASLLPLTSAAHPPAQQDAAPAQTAPPAAQDSGNAAQPQTATPSKPTPSASQPPPKISSQKPAAAKRPAHKKVRAVNCDSAVAPISANAGSPAGAGNGTAQGGTTTSAKPSASKNCPPSKIIVRQGGTSEPSIQLAGGASGDQAATQRDATNQMLGSTDANLKKLAGRTLSANQQDMVNQVRQFMQQSRTAIDAGDLERARTLAWKAQLLSEELVKPAK